LNSTPASRPTSPSRSDSSSGITMNPGTPAAPGPASGAPGAQSERPTPRPPVTPSSGGTPEPGARIAGSSSTSERPGAGGRTQL
jgi:hypothetical protein